jgi:hypothetical protein
LLAEARETAGEVEGVGWLGVEGGDDDVPEGAPPLAHPASRNAKTVTAKSAFKKTPLSLVCLSPARLLRRSNLETLWVRGHQIVI